MTTRRKTDLRFRQVIVSSQWPIAIISCACFQSINTAHAHLLLSTIVLSPNRVTELYLGPYSLSDKIILCDGAEEEEVERQTEEVDNVVCIHYASFSSRNQSIGDGIGIHRFRYRRRVEHTQKGDRGTICTSTAPSVQQFNYCTPRISSIILLLRGWCKLSTYAHTYYMPRFVWLKLRDG